MAKKKTSAQLNREINEALSGGTSEHSAKAAKGDRVVADLARWGVDRESVGEVRAAFRSGDHRRAMALANDLGWNRSAKRGRSHHVGKPSKSKASLSASDAKARLFAGTFPTGISYADKAREKDGDYMRIAFLPFSTLVLEWSPGRHPPEIRELVAADAAKIIARRGQEFQVSMIGQTARLGHLGKRVPTGDAEIRAAVKRGHGDTTTEHSDRCNTCTRPKASPFRRHDASGKVTEGCIDAAHTGHIYGDNLRWHMRPEAKKLRKNAVERLRGMISGKRA